jgi:transcriptional regulator with XRE-family HTH domain
VATRSWARELTHRVAREIKRRRGQQTTQQLSDRTAELGHRVGRSRIFDLERGDRGAPLGLAELIVLAKALGVPPLELIFSLGKEPTTEILPGLWPPTWEAAKWFSGAAGFPKQMPDGTWEATAGDPTWSTRYFREQDDLKKRWRELDRRAAEARARSAREPEWAERLERAEEDLRRYEDLLRSHRSHMRDLGLDPEPLEAELAHLDGQDGGLQ